MGASGSADTLGELYKRWLLHGVNTPQCKDVLRYLGKKVPARGYGGCTGEVKIDLRQRAEGTRLKFWYNTNSIKMYDKQARAFRIETTINQPHAFKAYRTREGDRPDGPKAWRVMRKGVADLARRAEVSQAANNRLAESLATVAAPHTLGELLQPLGRPVVRAGRRRARALNPLTGKDGELPRTLAQGNFLVRGFRNTDLRVAFYGEASDPVERRRQSAAVTRRLALLRAHGAIVRIAGCYRYHLSASGRRVVTALLAAHASKVVNLTTTA